MSDRVRATHAASWSVGAFAFSVPYFWNLGTGWTTFAAASVVAVAGYLLTQIIYRTDDSVDPPHLPNREQIGERVDLSGKALLDCQETPSGRRGWPHYLGSVRRGYEAQVLGTAYGLLAATAAGVSPEDYGEREVVDTLLQMRSASGLWASSSQGGDGSPEATAIVVTALWPHLAEVGAIGRACAWLGEWARGRHHQRQDPMRCVTVSEVLTCLGTIAPSSEAMRALFQRALDMRLETPGGGCAWGIGARAGDRPTVVHTARMITGLRAVPTELRPRRAAEAIAESQRWLASTVVNDATTIEPLHEEIVRQQPYSKLSIRHYPPPWIVLALVDSEAELAAQARRTATERIMRTYDSGLWRWPGVEGDFPIWMTYQCILALRTLAGLDETAP